MNVDMENNLIIRIDNESIEFLLEDILILKPFDIYNLTEIITKAHNFKVIFLN